MEKKYAKLSHPVLIKVLTKVFSPFLSFVFPPFCISCRQPLPESRYQVCTHCRDGFVRISEKDPAWIEAETKLKSAGYVSELISCYLFEKEGGLQDVIHHLKYRGMKSLGIMLGEEVGKVIVLKWKLSDISYIVPVPLHKLKYRERGYNQSEMICRGIQAVTGIPVNSSLVVRSKYTETQTKLNQEERRENLSDAFSVTPGSYPVIQGKKILLVDDIITTGSTLTECAKTLIGHGAQTVMAASVALAR